MRKLAFLAAALAAAGLTATPAFAQQSGGVTITNSTVSGNSTRSTAGAGPHVRVFSGSGGALHQDRTTFDLADYSLKCADATTRGTTTTCGKGGGILNFNDEADARDALDLAATTGYSWIEGLDGQVIVFTGLEVAEGDTTSRLTMNFTKVEFKTITVDPKS